MGGFLVGGVQGEKIMRLKIIKWREVWFVGSTLRRGIVETGEGKGWGAGNKSTCRMV